MPGQGNRATYKPTAAHGTYGHNGPVYTIDVMATKGTMHMQGWDWGPSGVAVAFHDNSELETFCPEPGKYGWVGGASYVAECLLTGQNGPGRRETAIAPRC